jgi:hypothetical protein
MSRISTKDVLLKGIHTEKQKLDQTLQGTTEALLLEPGVCGEWSIKDVLAHLLEWQRMVRGWYEMGLRGETPRPPSPDFHWGQLPLLNQRIYETYRDEPLDKIRAGFEESHQYLLNLVQTLPEDELFKPGLYPWLKKSTLGNYITSSTSSHYRWARDLIRKGLKAQTL